MKTTLRYLFKHKSFSAINLIGLTTGMCVCFFALLYVNFELSYDTGNPKADRIYRVVTDIKTASGLVEESSPEPMAAAFKNDFPEIESTTRIFLDYYIVQKDGEDFGEQHVAYADSSIFSVFNFPLIIGKPSTVFNSSNNAVLSESAAMKYFGSIDCIGKTLVFGSDQKITITGVMKDIPFNSHFRTDILLSMQTLVEPGSDWTTNWSRFGFYTYLLLPEDYDIGRLNSRLTAFAGKNFKPDGKEYSLAAEPLSKVYLEGKPRGNKAGSTATGNIRNVYIFMMIAVLVLFVACFNFINLTTAISIQRTKEVSLRKVLGASRGRLILQFLLDSVFLCGMAFILALGITELLLPAFNGLAGKVVSTTIIGHFNYIGLLLLIGIATAIVSGIYPAMFLSGYDSIKGLKGDLSGTRNAFVRKGLVVSQFSISIVLIVATIVVYTQLDYVQNKQLGFKKDNKLVIDFHYDKRITGHFETITDEFMKLPGVSMAGISSAIPGKENKKFATTIQNSQNEMQDFQSDGYFIDYNFVKQYDLKLIGGRLFSNTFATDLRTAMIINETAMKTLGYTNPKDVIGKAFTQSTAGGEGLVIGVIKDFHYHSSREEVRPLTLRIAPGFLTFLTLDLNTKDVRSTVALIEQKWKELAPGMPMSYSFMDEVYNEQYQSEQRFGKLFICFSIFAIFISCLGLYGLSAFSTVQRKKEIGIRKVLGASVNGIATLLSADLLKLVVAAFIIATPVAWWLSRQWLMDFAYRIDISWWMFASAGVLTVLIAFFSVASLAVRAALANPVKSLRSE